MFYEPSIAASLSIAGLGRIPVRGHCFHRLPPYVSPLKVGVSLSSIFPLITWLTEY